MMGPGFGEGLPNPFLWLFGFGIVLGMLIIGAVWAVITYVIPHIHWY